MRLRSLTHKNYRGLKDSSEHFDKVNHIIGKNGSGKTSLIEAITVLLNGRSFQESALKNLLNKEKSFFRLAGNFQEKTTTQDQLSLTFDQGLRAHKLNNKRLGQQRAHTLFPVCLIDTSVIQASSGQPNYRRSLLDRAVFHVEPQHARNHNNFKKCLSQRNRAITKGEDMRTVQSWDEPLAELGQKISDMRIKLIEEAEEGVETIANNLIGESLSLAYERGWEEDSYIESLKTSIKKDMIMKRTTTGPQKDDFKIMSRENKIKGYYSHGQEKLASISFMLGLNLAIEKRKKRSSIIIIDEAESGLDEDSTLKLIKVLKSYKNQIFITSLPHHRITKMFGGNILNATQK